jgi:hypothetical protein
MTEPSIDSIAIELGEILIGGGDPRHVVLQPLLVRSSTQKHFS